MKKLLTMIGAAAIALATALPSFAADWTDANDVTYTALKSINGGGSGLIVTDFTPAGTEIVKFKFKPSTVSGDECVFCSCYYESSQPKAQFRGFRISDKLRFDRASYYTYNNNTYPRQSTCNTTTLSAGEEYSVVANFGGASIGTVTINDTPQSLTPAMETANYTPGSVLVLLASHALAANVTPTSSSTFWNKATGDLYYFQLWNADGKTLAHDFRPAKRVSDDAIGLYDTATRKFWPATAGSFTGAAYSANDRAGKKWTGLGADNKMSNGANWQGGVAPSAGDDLDFTIAVPFAAIDADIDATFGKIYLGTGDLPAFTGSLIATSASDLARIQDYADETASFTFSIAYIWNGAGSNWGDANAWDCDNAAATWEDNNNAIFSTANATATLAADATAASVAFNAPATIDGAATLTVPTVSVASGVSATISAPTAGALEKTGAGTLALTRSRTAATTVTAGTLKMDGATLSNFTLGTDGGAPVVFDYGGQSLQKNPADYLVTGSDVTLTNGTFWMSGAMSIRDNTKIPAVLTIAKDATLRQTGNNSIIIDKDNGTATVNVVGGTFGKTSGNNDEYIQHASLNGRLNINVTDGGLLTFSSSSSSHPLRALCGGNVGTTPSLYMMFSNATFYVAGTFKFGNSDNSYGVSTAPTGVFAATNSTITVADTFAIGRNLRDEKTDGSYTFDFENCVVTTRYFGVYHDRPLNNVRFNGTRFVFRAASGSIAASDGADNWITVGDSGLTFDTQAFSCTLGANLGGSGAVTKVGTGTLTVASNQTASAAFNVNEGTLAVNGGVSISRPIAVANGAKLQVNATDTASISSLTPATGSTLDIASYNGTTPLALTSLTLPADGTVNLTLNGGAFPQGVYAVCSAPGVTESDGAKFAPSTGTLGTTWRVENNALILTVGEVSGNYWTGRGGDGRMSTAANWAGNAVPAAGSDIDLSVITAATTIIADANRTFGAVTMGTGVITFTNAMAATSFTDTAKIAVAADSTVTLDGDLVFADSTSIKYIVYTVAEGGVFRVTGRIVLTRFTGAALLGGSVANICPGTIAAKGLFNDCTKDNNNHPRFVLGRDVNNYHGTWAIGSDGLVGSGGFQTSSSSGASATIVAEADFVDSANICNLGSLVIDAAGHEVVLGTNTLAGSGGIYGGCTSTITGGRVVANYDVDNLTTFAGSLNNPFTVNSGATLALVTGADLGTGAVTVQDGGTLEVTESGTVTLGGNLTLKAGAKLGFNYTGRDEPVLDLTGKTVTFDEGATTNVIVKISADAGKRAKAGANVLTSSGGQFSGVTVSLDETNKPDWAMGVSVNENGEIVLDVKPMGMVIFVQ